MEYFTRTKEIKDLILVFPANTFDIDYLISLSSQDLFNLCKGIDDEMYRGEGDNYREREIDPRDFFLRLNEDGNIPDEWVYLPARVEVIRLQKNNP